MLIAATISRVGGATTTGGQQREGERTSWSKSPENIKLSRPSIPPGGGRGKGVMALCWSTHPNAHHRHRP